MSAAFIDGMRLGLEDSRGGMLATAYIKHLVANRPKDVFVEEVVGLANDSSGQTMRDCFAALRPWGFTIHVLHLDTGQWWPQHRQIILLFGHDDSVQMQPECEKLLSLKCLVPQLSQ